jgi:hypothetical protein
MRRMDMIICALSMLPTMGETWSARQANQFNWR